MLKAFEKNKIKPKKKNQGFQFPAKEEALHTWYQQLRAKNLPVSGPLMIEKAAKFASRLQAESFKVMADECEFVSAEVMDSWNTDVLLKLSENWDTNTFTTATKVDYFIRCYQIKHLHTIGEKCHGSKKSKERVTVMFCANMDGSDKCKLAVIGKFQNPKCFKNVRNLPQDYFAQKMHGWIQKYTNNG